MPSGVGTGVDEPGLRPLGWRGLTGLNEPSYNGGGAQGVRGQLTNPFIPHWRGNLNAIRLASLVSSGAIFGFTFGTLSPQKYPNTN